MPAWAYRQLTGGGVLVAVTLVVLELAVVLQSRLWWRGDGLWAVQRIGAPIQLGLPLMLALYAVPPAARGGVRASLDLLPSRPRQERFLRLASDAALPLLVHLGFVLSAIIWARANGDSLEMQGIVVCVVTQLLTLSFIAAVGRATAEVVGHPTAVLAAAGIGVLFVTLASNAMPVSAGSSPYAGLTLALPTYLIGGTTLLMAGALCLLRSQGRLAGQVTTALGMVLVLVVGSRLQEPRVVPSGAQPTSCERVVAVDVCVFPGYEFMAPALVEQAERTLSVLRDHRIDPQLDLVAQSTPGVVEAPGSVSLPFVIEALEAGGLGRSMVRGSLIHPNWCPLVNSPDPLPASFDAAQVFVFHWLSHAEGELDDTDYLRLVPEFATRPEDEQRAFVQGYFDDNHDCTGLT